MRLARRSGLYALGILLCASLAWAGPADLRPKFNAGKETFYRSAAAIDQTMEMGAGTAQPMAVHMDVETGMSLKVTESLPDGGAKLELTLLYLKLGSNMPAMPMNIDTRDESTLQSSPIGPMLNGFVNKPIVLTVDASGAITSVTGFDKLAGAMGPAAQLMEDIFSERALKQMPLFPTAKVGKSPTPTGHKWKDTVEFDFGTGASGGLNIDTEYELGAVDEAGKTAQIPYVTKTSLKPQDPATSQPAAMMSFKKADGTARGTIRWDMAAGESIENRSKQNLELEVQVGGNQTMRQKMEVLSSLERVDKDAMVLKKAPGDEPTKTTQPAPKPAIE